jgi:hypothetical protein
MPKSFSTYVAAGSEQQAYTVLTPVFTGKCEFFHGE